MNESGIDFEQLASFPRKDQESLHGRKIDRPTLLEIEKSTQNPELKKKIAYLRVYSSLGPSEAKTIQLTKFWNDFTDHLVELMINTTEPGANATQAEVDEYNEKLAEYADFRWLLQEVIDPQLSSKAESTPASQVPSQEDERQKAVGKIQEITKAIDDFVSDAARQQQVADIEASLASGNVPPLNELDNFENILKPLKSELDEEANKLRIIKGGLENRYKNLGDTEAQETVQDVDQKYFRPDSELNKLANKIDRLLFKIWQLRIPSEFPQNQGLLSELTYVAPTNGNLQDQLLARTSDIASLETKIADATTEFQSKSGSLSEEQKRYIDAEFLSKANAQLQERKNNAYTFFENNLQDLYPSLRDLIIAIDVVESGGVVGDPTQALDILRQQLSLSEAEVAGVTFSEPRYRDLIESNYFERARRSLGTLGTSKDKFDELQKNNLDVNFLNLENPNPENAFRWLRTQIDILESNFNSRFDANENLYNSVKSKIASLKAVDADLGGKLEAEFGARGALHNDFRAHMIDKQMMKQELIDNPDMYAPQFAHFYKEMNSIEQKIPVAHARRMFSRAFQGRLRGTTVNGRFIDTSNVDASNYAQNDDDVREVIIQRLIEESGSGYRPDGTPYKIVTKQEAALAVKLAERLSVIEHERALQDYAMKQTEPDKYRDYMHFPERQLYYREKDRTSASFIASVYLFAEPKVVEAMRREVNPNFAPLVLLPPRAESVELEVDHATGKVQFEARNFQRHWKNPGYSFIGDLYSFSETKKDKPKEIIFSKAESRWRYKLLSDVISSDGDRDPIFGYELASEERMHEDIDWNSVDPRLFKLWINQLFNVKKATDEFFVEKDISARKLETIEFYEDLATPIDYTMATTYRVRDADMGFQEVARQAGVTDPNLLNSLRNDQLKGENAIPYEQRVQIIDNLLADVNFANYLTANGISTDEARNGLLTLFMTKKDMRIRMQEITMLGFVYANHVNKNPGLHDRWDEANNQEVSEILEVAVQAGFITHEGEKWIKDSIPKLSIALKEMLHGIATRARKEGL